MPGLLLDLIDWNALHDWLDRWSALAEWGVAVGTALLAVGTTVLAVATYKLARGSRVIAQTAAGVANPLLAAPAARRTTAGSGP